MLRIKNKLIAGTLGSLVLATSMYAFSISALVSAVAPTAVEALISAALDEDSSLIITDSTLLNTVDVKGNSQVYFSNLGIRLAGTNVEVQGSTLLNTVDVRNSWIVASNLGIEFEGDYIAINGATLLNTVDVHDSTVVGSNLGITNK